jgi:putative addiction module component (TIGR02574 family)
MRSYNSLNGIHDLGIKAMADTRLTKTGPFRALVLGRRNIDGARQSMDVSAVVLYRHGCYRRFARSVMTLSPTPYNTVGIEKQRREIMSKKLEEIINVAKDLSLEERAELAGALLLSLDEPSESEVERLWLQEAERRLQEYRDGKMKGIPAEEVFNRAIADIS